MQWVSSLVMLIVNLFKANASEWPLHLPALDTQLLIPVAELAAPANH